MLLFKYKKINQIAEERQESEVTMSYRRKNAKRSRKLTAGDCFVLGLHILGQDTKKSASKMADKLRTMWLYMAGAWVYNKTYFFKVPMLWVFGAVHFVIAFMPIETTSVEAHGNHVLGNMMFLAMWLMFSAMSLVDLERETAEDEEIRENRLKSFLRKHYYGGRKNEKRRDVA